MDQQLSSLAQKLAEQRIDITNSLQVQWKQKLDEALETGRMLELETRDLRTEVCHPLLIPGKRFHSAAGV